ncbi:alpha/beta fold hydrolase [Streptomyces griseus]|uniref:Hydrolase n=1 Tax=Streptomyces griseus subsp. griseus (strain JCM 4626 / CBS 651.72 / NBRC 13350 / KCC S-0626 / ISP 5235) TaxID=455632 RepID=B1VL52_STRGG|nr:MULTISPECIES: alpha/beta hydrolase [Streptomyces]MYR50879.1 alpha/beta fold hydrolase [Streptomyces sp. SID4928]EGE42838.1 alpha/beta hydrolase fold protein [Streptomyces sp. ACT-1]MBW3705726.1 alpha/beta hydrolase [Streptomyces griseus]NEB55190.1 alpha/beta hydrolase [Streptomyces griseus]SEE83884.1 Pimeloyl-ACP methyl ester carboxylesterase [Streptomyces griseus]
MTNVVLLHGLANNEAVWSGLKGHWPAELEVHAPRLPWHGGGIADWRHETDSAARLGDVLDAVPGGPDVVVAHSFSSVVLLDLLARRAAAGDPPDLAAVVLVNPFYRGDADDFHWDMIAPTLADFPRTMAESIRLRTPGRTVDAELLADMARRMTEWIGPYGWLRFFDAYLRTPLFRVDLIETPALVIGGGDDRSAPPDQARGLAARLPAGRSLTVPGCGHFPMLERPAWFTSTVHAFLERTPEHPLAVT